MTKVSRFKLSSEQINQLSKRIAIAVSSLRDRDMVMMFFDDLLTSTEKIMLGKRILIALLLEKGKPYGEIGSVVKVSQTTIAAVSERLQRGGTGLRRAIQYLEKEEKIERMLEKIFSPIRFFVSPLTSKTSTGYYKLRKRH